MQATQKKIYIRRLSVKPGLRGSNDLRVGRKMATFLLFFNRVGLRTYYHACNLHSYKFWLLVYVLLRYVSQSRH